MAASDTLPGAGAPAATAGPPDDPAEAPWQAFLAALGTLLAGLWPAMPERLGERYAAFVDHAAQQAGKKGLARAGAVARYVNLCFVWGPSFQDRPGFEWAQALLAGTGEDWLAGHRLVQRSLAELARLPDSPITTAQLQAADARLLARFGGLGPRGALHPPEPLPAPVLPCDLDGAELRLLSLAGDQRFDLLAGTWQRVPVALPPPLRCLPGQPWPADICTLSALPGAGTPTRMQLRARPHAQCSGDLHPLLLVDGPQGRWRWVGHETRAVSWPLPARAQPVPAAGPGAWIAEATAPEVLALALHTCGLREEGPALGSAAAQLRVWPAAQWWQQWQRAEPAAAGDIGDAAVASSGSVAAAGLAGPSTAMRCQIDCDGVAQGSSGLRSAFEQGLDGAAAQAWQRLLSAWVGGEAWAAAPAPAPGAPPAAGGVVAPALPPASALALNGQARLALLVGRAAFAWGWAHAEQGLAAPPWMRLVGEVALDAIVAELRLEAQLQRLGFSALLSLQLQGRQGLQASFRRDAAGTALAPQLAAGKVQWKLPFSAEVVPLAGGTGGLLQANGPCRGALAGEAGLRPCTGGGSGWEWYAQLRCEAVVLPLRASDPVLGTLTFDQPLLPALDLLDWKA